MNALDRMTLQRAEFDAASDFAKHVGRHDRTPVVDDDYPQVRHEYESSLAALLAAMKANGRFDQQGSNRYALTTPPPASQERGGDIPETMFHGAGAYAQCHYCKRYSRDPATLSDRAPVCECGKEHGWSGSFVPPTPESTFTASPPSSAAEPDSFGVASPFDHTKPPVVRPDAFGVAGAAEQAKPVTVENALIGTIAPAIGGGHWCRVPQGWKWNGPSGFGSTFPRPGGDWNGKLTMPMDEQAKPVSSEDDPNLTYFDVCSPHAEQAQAGESYLRKFQDDNTHFVESLPRKISEPDRPWFVNERGTELRGHAYEFSGDTHVVPVAVAQAEIDRLNAALLRRLAGGVTPEMIKRALNAQPFSDDNNAARVWQFFQEGFAIEDIIRAALVSALSGGKNG